MRKWNKPRLIKNSKFLLLHERLVEEVNVLAVIAEAVREYVDYHVHDFRRR